MVDDLHNLLSSRFRINFVIPHETTGGQIHITMPLIVVWGLHKVATSVGPHLTEFVALIGAQAIKATPVTQNDQAESPDDTLSPEELDRVEIVVRYVAKTARDKWPKSEDLLIDASYQALRGGFLSRAQAAEFARELLGRKIEPDTWRKRVDRWAEKKGLPKVEQYKRRTPDNRT